MTIKYKIEQCNHYQRTLWVVKYIRSGKIISHHEFKDDAEKAAQRYVAEDYSAY